MSILEWRSRTLKEKLKPAEQLQSWRSIKMSKEPWDYEDATDEELKSEAQLEEDDD